MRNILNFYYNMQVDNIEDISGTYFFTADQRNYYFTPYYNNTKIEDIYLLNNYLINHFEIDKIILNRDNSPITHYNNIPYILIEKRQTSLPSLAVISNLANIQVPVIKALERNNWEILWGNIIDYYEAQVGENEKKYPLIRESFDYYVGLAENAISYIVNTKKEEKKENTDIMVLSHSSLNMSLFNPLNIIFDHKSRDLAEYIKLSFFSGRDIINNLSEYFYYNRYSLYGIRILFARLIYPSYYFKMYDEIVSGKKEEKELINIIDKNEEYEEYLYKIYLYLKKYYNIPPLEWLKNEKFNSRLLP